jgi:hypothetical protein
MPQLAHHDPAEVADDAARRRSRSQAMKRALAAIVLQLDSLPQADAWKVLSAVVKNQRARQQDQAFLRSLDRRAGL